MTVRLTHPLRYDAKTDRYQPINWDEAFVEIGDALKALPRESVIFYASWHAGLEASYLYALLARSYGNNNLPHVIAGSSEATFAVFFGTCERDGFWITVFPSNIVGHLIGGVALVSVLNHVPVASDLKAVN